ncbi:hypothetical protein VTG60DRAFT_653 [Thermothelomyces hinnuleus]
MKMGLREKFRQKFGHSTHKAGAGSAAATQASAFSRGNVAEAGVEAATPSTAILGSHAGGSQALDDTPIRKLWDLAYDKLREEEEGAILEYEKKLQVCGDLGSVIGTGVPRRERMTGLLQRKMDEVNRDSWKLRFGSKEVLVKDLAEPVLGIISRANDYITGAVAANPYAATAWTGVALLLPVRYPPM